MEKEKLLVSCFLSTHQHLINTSVAVSFLASWSLGTNEYVTTIVPSVVCILHCPSLLQLVKLLVVSVVCCWLTFKQSNENISGGAVLHFHTYISHCPFRCLLLRARKIIIFLFNLSLVEPLGVL